MQKNTNAHIDTSPVLLHAKLHFRQKRQSKHLIKSSHTRVRFSTTASGLPFLETLFLKTQTNSSNWTRTSVTGSLCQWKLNLHKLCKHRGQPIHSNASVSVWAACTAHWRGWFPALRDQLTRAATHPISDTSSQQYLQIFTLILCYGSPLLYVGSTNTASAWIPCWIWPRLIVIAGNLLAAW